MTECLYVALKYFLPNVLVGKECIFLIALIEPPRDLFLQGVGA